MEHCLEKPKSIFLSETAVNLKNIDPDINHLKLRTDRYFNDFQRNDESGLTKDSALKIIQNELSAMDREVLGVLSLDENEQPINVSYVATGDLTSAPGASAGNFQDSDSIRGGFSNPVSQSSFRGYRSIRDG